MKALIVLALFGAVSHAFAQQGVCPEDIPMYMGTLSNSGTGDLNDWVISPTSITTTIPPWDQGSGISGGGYIQQFLPGGDCIAALAFVTFNATATNNGCSYGFTDNNNNVASVDLLCGNASTMKMNPTVDAVLSDGIGSNSFGFTGYINSVCPGATKPLLRRSTRRQP